MTNDEIIEMWKNSGDLDILGMPYSKIEAFAKLVAAKEREACARKTEEFARKWWKVHCDSNLHYSSTLKAHQDFCVLQAAIRARGEA